MIEIPDSVKHLLDKQHVAIVSTLDDDGVIHTSAKGVVEVDPKGKVFVLDLYKARTFRNVEKNSNVTLTVIDEHRFKGYSLSGKAIIVEEKDIPKEKMNIWHEKLATRIARRVISHVKEERPHEESIPEASFPMPKYLIKVLVDKIIDLAPQRLKK